MEAIQYDTICNFKYVKNKTPFMFCMYEKCKLTKMWANLRNNAFRLAVDPFETIIKLKQQLFNC